MTPRWSRLGLLLPERCAVCGVPGEALCAPCRDAAVRMRPPVCDRCGSPGPGPVRRCAECSGRRLAFARARSALVYDASARALVREWKEHGRRGLADEAAALSRRWCRGRTSSARPRPG